MIKNEAFLYKVDEIKKKLVYLILSYEIGTFNKAYSSSNKISFYDTNYKLLYLPIYISYQRNNFHLR